MSRFEWIHRSIVFGSLSSQRTARTARTAIILLAALLSGMAATVGAPASSVKIEPALFQALSNAGQADFFVWMTVKADLTPARQFANKEQTGALNPQGQFVLDRLRQVSDVSQAALRADLSAQGVRYRSFYIANKLLVLDGSRDLALALASRSDVARLTLNRTYQLDAELNPNVRPSQPAAVEPNLIFIRADQVWALGITGQGTVLSANDTGIQWDHPALKAHYRGWNGATADHNYNWWDATGQYPYIPADGFGHGTMVTGVMVGDDGGSNQIGVAPGAQVIHCKMLLDDGSTDEAMITECLQWNLAPWDLSGSNPRPDLAPDAITNSWGFWGGGDPRFEDEIDALLAAGIMVEFSAGGEGSGCATIRSPGDYEQVLTVGAVDSTGGVLPGVLSPFSARGPSTLDPLAFFPDVVAPGIDIRSSAPTNGYQVWSGTSLSGPHVTGLIGLMWSANPALRGLITETEQIIDDTAAPLTGQNGSNCGGDYVTGPNNDWGYGAIDALAAVQIARVFGDTGTLQGTVADALSGAALENAQVQASLGPYYSWITPTNSAGNYVLTVLSGTYTVSASLPGYLPAAVSNLSVISSSTTLQNFALTPVFTVSGTIRDANTGWPLAAHILVTGGVITNTWSDPTTGLYQFGLPGGEAYTLTFQALTPGYDPLVAAAGLLTHTVQLDVALPAGWLVVEPPSLSAAVDWGISATLSLTLTNVGGRVIAVTASDHADWLTVSPPTATLAISSNLVLTAQFDPASLAQPSVYTTSLQLGNDTPYGPVILPVTLTVGVPPVYGVDLSPGTNWESWPGSVITLSLWLTNTGSLTDTFTLSLTQGEPSDPGWPPVQLSITQTTLAAAERVQLFLTVAIPDALDGQSLAITLKAVSHHNPAKTDSSLITVTCRWRRLYFPVVER